MKIAEITIPTKPGEKPKTKFLKHITFKCIRCGTFCCHLGSPELTAEDMYVLKKKFAKDLTNLIERREIKTRQEDYLLPFGLKSINDSECIFLKRNKQGKSGCKIYKIRPLLCRSFPFIFKQKGNKIDVEVIPCPGIKMQKNKGSKKKEVI